VTSDCCLDAPPGSHVYVAHIAGGEVSFFSSTASGVELMDFSGGFFNPETGIRGGFSLAPSIPGDAQAPVFLSSRVDNAIASFVIRDNARIIRTRRIGVGGLSPGNDVRGIAVAPGGDVLYAVDRLPPALVALDLAERDGAAAGEALWAVDVCGEPSVLRLGPDPRAPTDPTPRLAYVVCFEDAQIDVVDTVTAQVVTRITTGSGPNALELDPRNKRAFIANFAENTVGVIDLDPAHSTFMKMVLRIGMARRPEQG
jgi:DNA-binding beta-propeller fold protein YncE